MEGDGGAYTINSRSLWDWDYFEKSHLRKGLGFRVLRLGLF